MVNDFNNANTYNLKSLELAEKQKDTLAIVICLNNLTSTYQTFKHYDLAFKSIEKAHFLSKFTNVQTQSESLIAYAHLLNEVGRWEEAIEKLNQCMYLFSNIDTDIKSNTLVTIADILLSREKYEEAKPYLARSLEVKHLLNDNFQVKLYHNIAAVALWKNQSKSAIVNAEKSLEISEKYNYVDLSIKNHHFLYQIYKKNKQTDKALYHIEKLKALNDTLFFQDKNKKVAELQFRYDLQKSENEVNLLRTNRKQLMLYGSATFSFVLLLLFGYISYSKGQNLKNLKQKNKEINTKNEKLKTSNQLLSEFARASAHDLKEPLRNIGSYASLFRYKYKKDIPESSLVYLDFIDGGVKKMYQLMEDLLKFISIISIEIPTEIASISIADEIKKTVEDFTFKHSNNIVFETNGLESLPKLSLIPIHIKHLFKEILSNAVKFNNNSTPIIRINAVTTDSEVRISINDNGIGINSEFHQKIFQLFYRLDKTTPRYQGSGVGLSICKNIMEQYGGKIYFESEEGNGTTLVLVFPVSD